MQSFKIFIAGMRNIGKTCFIQAVSDIDVVSTELQHRPSNKQDPSYTISLDFGRITISDEIALYFFSNPGARDAGILLKYLGKNGFMVPGVGLVMMINTANCETDPQNAVLLEIIQEQNLPYVVALSKQDLPNARTPLQMRQILNIPDDIKLLSYGWKDPKSTKQVVLELVKLFPRDELVERVIEGLKAKIDEA